MAVYFGYFASLMLIVALLVNNDIKFRWYNLAGSISFVIYGILLWAIPVLITNIILMVINIVYLIKIYNKKENFDLIEFTGDEKLVNKFLSFYQDDIQLFFPAFKQSDLVNKLNFVVLRDVVIANLFSAEIHNNGDAEVLINYTLGKYRDFKVGRFIFEKERVYLLSKGVKRIVYKKLENKNHLHFLKVMGFEQMVENDQQLLVKTL